MSAPSPDGSSFLARRLAAVRRWGDFTQAYSTATQEGLAHFWHGDGYLAYQMKWRIACVLGDPVAPAEQIEPLLAAFLAERPRACFWQISRGTAEVLARLGFWINEMGVDTRIDLADYDFGGKQKERLRHAGNWLDKNGYSVREGAFGARSAPGSARGSDCPALGIPHTTAAQPHTDPLAEPGAEGGGGVAPVRVDAAEIRALSESWQAGRRIKATVRFFNRPIVLADEPDVRKFFLFSPAGKVEAFVFFDPIFRDGRVVGYSPAIKRRDPDAPLRAEEGIMKHAIEQFQREGRERVMLGLSPLAGIEDREFRANPLVTFSWRRGLNAWWVNRFFYNLKGHADFKRRFGGVEEQTYFASKALFNDLRVVASLRLAGVL